MAVVIAVALTALAPHVALADTLTVAQYRQRLEQARADLVRARGPSGAQSVFLDQAQATLRQTTAITLPSGGALDVDDSSLVAGLDARTASIDTAIARLDARIELASRIANPRIDAATADARLHDIVDRASAPEGGDLLAAIQTIILRFLAGLRGPSVDLTQIWPALGVLGIALTFFILATLGRALPERLRREVLVRGGPTLDRADPSVHLRAADAAIVGARPRDAIHALFLYVITALAARETIAYDPALTDRELLVRAAAIPHADAFRDLVGLYERAWFGLRDPSIQEARRARDLALRVAP